MELLKVCVVLLLFSSALVCIFCKGIYAVTIEFIATEILFGNMSIVVVGHEKLSECDVSVNINTGSSILNH